LPESTIWIRLTGGLKIIMAFKIVKIGAAALSLLGLGASIPAFAAAPSDNPMHLTPPRTVTLVVANLDKEVAWYSSVLGFRDTKKFGQANPNAKDRVARIELAGFRLDLVWHTGSTRAPPPALFNEGYSHVSFESTTMDENYKWLTDHGVKIDSEVRDKATNALRIMRFHDPEGNEIHIELPN
jgi:catechol 2,3-dioxygenase-like lactoylglutathione lyase family enzyme